MQLKNHFNPLGQLRCRVRTVGFFGRFYTQIHIQVSFNLQNA